MHSVLSVVEQIRNFCMCGLSAHMHNKAVKPWSALSNVMCCNPWMDLETLNTKLLRPCPTDT